MAKKISARDIFTNEDIFKNIRKSADETIVALGKINAEFKKTASTLKSTIGQTKFDSTKNIKEFITMSEKANRLAQESAKVEALRQKAIQQSARATQELQKAEQQKSRTAQQNIRLSQQQARASQAQALAQAKQTKAMQNQASAYKTLERETRSLKNQSKELGAQMLVMEKNGQKGSAQYRQLSTSFRDVTQKAREGDAQLKKLDKTVGDNFRNVGNYQSALSGLNRAFGALGIAFGTAQIANFIKTAVSGFEDANAKLASVLGTTTATTGKLQAVQRELGRTTSYTAGEVGELQVELAKLGFQEPQIQKMSESVLKLAGASGVSLERSAEVAGGVLRMFELDASQMTHVADVMAKSFSTTALDMDKFAEAMKYVGPVANDAGLSLEDTAGMLGVLANQGIKGSKAGTSLRRILTDMAMTGKPAKEALAEVVEGGISLTDAFDEVGRTAQTSLLILSKNMDKAEELAETYKTADGAVNAMYRTMKDTVGGAFDRMTSAMQGYVLDVNDASGASRSLKKTFDFLADNMVPILNTIVLITKAFVYYKVITLSTIAVNKLMASSFMTTVRSVGVLKGAMMGLGAMAKSVGQMISNNIVGIAVLALATLYFQYKRIADIEAKVTENAEEMAEAQEAVAKNTKFEKEEMKNLFEELKKTNKGSTERINLIDEVNKRYGTTLENLEDEAKFVEAVDLAYLNLMATLEARANVEGKRIGFEVSSRNLAQVEMEIKGMEEKMKALSGVLVMGRLEDGVAPSAYKSVVGQDALSEGVGSLINNLFGIDDPNTLIQEFNALGDVYENLYKQQKKYKDEYLKAQAEEIKKRPAKPITPIKLETENDDDDDDDDDPSKPRGVQDYDLELANFQAYVDKRIALDEQLRVLRGKSDFSVREGEIEAQINNIVLATKNLAIAGKDAFGDIVAGEMFDATEREIIKLYDYLKEMQKKETDFEISEIKRKYAEEKALEEKKIKDNYNNLVEKYTKDRANMVKSIASGGDVAGSLTKMDVAKKKLDDEYAIQLQKLSDDNVKRAENEALEILVVEQNGADKEIVIERDKNEKINDYNERRNVSYAEGVEERQAIAEADAKTQEEIAEDLLEKEMQRRQDINAVVQASADFFIEQSNRKIAQLDLEIAKAEENFNHYQKLAENGNINAKESLEVQSKIIAEANKKKMIEERRMAMLELAKTAYSTYQSKVDANSKNPLADTIKDITLLQAFIKTIPAFEEGTEDTGTSGRGVDGRGGFHAILHPNERVVPKSLNEQIGDLTNTELANLATNYRAGKIGQTNQSGSALDLAILVNEIKDLKTIIKNKPETNIELGEITTSIMEVVQSTTRGNETSYNRFKIRK